MEDVNSLQRIGDNHKLSHAHQSKAGGWGGGFTGGRVRCRAQTRVNLSLLQHFPTKIPHNDCQVFCCLHIHGNNGTSLATPDDVEEDGEMEEKEKWERRMKRRREEKRMRQRKEREREDEKKLG